MRKKSEEFSFKRYDTKEKVNILDYIKQVVDAAHKNNKDVEIIVGTDSVKCRKKRGFRLACYAVVVVFRYTDMSGNYEIGKGGHSIYEKINLKIQANSIDEYTNQRLRMEYIYTDEVVTLIQNHYINDKKYQVKFIDLDFNEHENVHIIKGVRAGKKQRCLSNRLVKESAYLAHFGIPLRVKPDEQIATVLADVICNS